MTSKLQFVLAFLLVALPVNGNAQQTELQSQEVYVGTPARISNNANVAGYKEVRKSVMGNTFAIPRSWKLVSAVPSSENVTSKQFVLFFQEPSGAVHSMEIDLDGSVTGKGILSLPVR